LTIISRFYQDHDKIGEAWLTISPA